MPIQELNNVCSLRHLHDVESPLFYADLEIIQNEIDGCGLSKNVFYISPVGRKRIDNSLKKLGFSLVGTYTGYDQQVVGIWIHGRSDVRKPKQLLLKIKAFFAKLKFK